MSYELDYTGVQIDAAIRKSIDRAYASVSKNVDVADEMIVSTPNIDVLLPLPLIFTTTQFNKFEASGQGVKYTGITPIKMAFNGVCTLGASANNTTIHLQLAKNGVTIPNTESAVKLSTSTDLNNANAALIIDAALNDVFTVYARADKACTVSAYHPQLTFVEL